MAIDLHRADPGDAAALTAIAFAAKRYWGYPEKWIECWRSALTIAPQEIAQNRFFVAKENEGIIGFAALSENKAECWLSHLWVLPDAMGRGVGRTLFSRAVEEATRAGARRLLIEADPHTEGFYLRVGALTIDRVPAPMEGTERFLPIMEKPLV